jgi:L,D-transpeptidase ErfK/SrfK
MWHRCHQGDRQRWVGMAARRSRGFARASVLALVGCSVLAACALENRPAWERAALARPSWASVARPTTALASQARNALPQDPAKAAPSAQLRKTAVERAALPPPGTAKTPLGQAVSPTSWGAAGKAVSALAPATEPARQVADPAWVGVETHVARHEDTLIDFAVEHNLGFIEVAMANAGVDPWLPGEGTPILLPKLHLPPDTLPRGIVLNLPEQRLYHYESGRLLRSYAIGIGRDGHATPIGSTTIVRKQENPTWYPTASAWNDDPTLPTAVPPGPDNPLGNRAMYLGWTSYLIHGTNKEYGIGRRASRGCIRMYSDDAVALYDRVGVGTPVTAVNQPVKVRWLQNELYIEASPTISQVQQWEEHGKFAPAAAGDVSRLVLKKAGAAADRIDWATVDRTVRERRGIPTRITRPLATPMLASAAKAPDENASSHLMKWLRRQLSIGGH